MPAIEWVHDDGGRAAAGWKGEKVGDCVVRALAIATMLPYNHVYRELFSLAGESPRNGVKKEVYKRWMLDRGWNWKPVMGIGTGCTMHLCAEELPSGILVLSLSRHVATVKDRVLYDTYDCSRDGTRCVYGYFHKGPDPAHAR